MVKAIYLYINDEMNDEILKELHERASNDMFQFYEKENEDFLNQDMFKDAKVKKFDDGIKIVYSYGYVCTADPLGIHTHVFAIKEE